MQLLQQCKQAAALCKPWQPSALHSQLIEQYQGVKQAVKGLLARFPGQEQLGVAFGPGLPTAGPGWMLQQLEAAQRAAPACAACGKLETEVAHLQRCSACQTH